MRRVVLGLGPYIADYPEQLLLACVINGWCARSAYSVISIRLSSYLFCRSCLSSSKDMDVLSPWRERDHDDLVVELFTASELKEQYGIVKDIVVCFLEYFK